MRCGAWFGPVGAIGLEEIVPGVVSAAGGGLDLAFGLRGELGPERTITRGRSGFHNEV
jgi:hypothetical protein